MKKGAAVFALFMFLAGVTVFAAEPVGYDAQRAAHRAEMTKIKKELREAKERKEKPVQTWFKSLNPVAFVQRQEEAYRARHPRKASDDHNRK